MLTTLGVPSPITSGEPLPSAIDTDGTTSDAVPPGVAVSTRSLAAHDAAAAGAVEVDGKRAGHGHGRVGDGDVDEPETARHRRDRSGDVHGERQVTRGVDDLHARTGERETERAAEGELAVDRAGHFEVAAGYADGARLMERGAGAEVAAREREVHARRRRTSRR